LTIAETALPAVLVEF